MAILKQDTETEENIWATFPFKGYIHALVPNCRTVLRERLYWVRLEE